MPADVIAGAVACSITVMILSYAISDNPAYRVAVHVFVGIAAGYIAAVAFWQVLLPDLILPLITGSVAERAMLAVPLLLSGMLLMKAWPGLSRLGAPAMGVLTGAAAAVAIGGAIQGTLLPQATATLDLASADALGSVEGVSNGLLIFFGAITSLAYFHFGARGQPDGTARRFGPVELMARLGGWFLAVTLGVLFAGVYAAALTALIERIHFLGVFLGLG